MLKEAPPDYYFASIDRYWEWTWERFNKQISEDLKAYMELFRNWQRLGDSVFSSGLTVRKFIEIRETALKGIIGLEGVDVQLGLGDTIRKECGSESSVFKEWLFDKGIVVRQEVERLKERYGGGWFDWESMGLIDEAMMESHESTSGNGTITSLDEAVVKMHECRTQGRRVLVALGSFDVGTEGQTLALDDLSWAAQKFGSLFVLVSGNKETKIVKGPGRPYIGLEKRMRFVANHSGVTNVSPILFEGVRTIEELVSRYQELHHILSELAHIRIIGDKDQWFSTYLEQCNDASLIFVHSESPRISSATEIGSQIYQSRGKK